jgi:formate dehydrogenase major subunit
MLCWILIGVNPTAGHPVIGARLKQAALSGCKLITIDPRRIELADHGVLHLAPRPGSNAAVMLGLAHVALREGYADFDFIAARTTGFEDFEELLAQYPPEVVEEISGVPADRVEAAAHLHCEAESRSDRRNSES